LKIIHEEVISKGSSTGTVIPVRTIVRLATLKDAHFAYLVHNHPSGNLNPSPADRDITEKVKNALALIDCRLNDHLIFSDFGYYSFQDEGVL
jgi:DNA repair protein RadC